VREIRYLALGDSYTIGEGVSEAERWPVQLAGLLRQHSLTVSAPEIIARTGWTAGELTIALQAQQPEGPFELVSLLIGVNDQYRGYDLERYRQEFRTLLQQAIELAGGDPGRVIVLSIPDWSVMPFAEGRNRSQIAAEIEQFNAVNREEAHRAASNYAGQAELGLGGPGVRYVDVTSLSRRAASDPALIARDGLHPPGKMYQAWAQAVLPEALAALGHPLP
jgi:lysophospholipase L1-like esterase